MTARAAKAAEHSATQWRDIKRCDVVLGYVEESTNEIFLYKDYLYEMSSWLSHIANAPDGHLLVRDFDTVSDFSGKTLSSAGKIYKSSRMALALSKENTELSLPLLDSINELQSGLSLGGCSKFCVSQSQVDVSV
ncbi:hypothetical protein GCM10011297_35250 [Bacterioplanes sanyensis]|nr:hypothetical protein GCM10011297_35250 [Bacterioplanes sanyensis]